MAEDRMNMKEETDNSTGHQDYRLGTKLIATKPPTLAMAPDPVVTPIYHSVNYNMEITENFRKQMTDGVVYARIRNPNTMEVEAVLTSIEQGIGALVYPSGMSAITSTLLCFLRPGDHLVIPAPVYHGTHEVITGFLKEWNIEVTEVPVPEDGDLTAAYDAATKPNTKLYWVESPVNPTTFIIDLEKLAKLGKERGVLTAVDATFAPAANQQPLTLGIDMVVHSCSKYLSGHSDILSGCVVFSQEDHLARMGKLRPRVTGPLDPANCVLLLRSLRTLHVRIKQHNENAQAVAEFLEGHPKVKRVLYTGLKSHPQYELAKKQMKGSGGMLAVILNSMEAAQIFTSNLKLFHIAGSLGAVECLVFPSGPFIQKFTPEEARAKAARLVDPGLVRLSIGVEDVGDIIADIQQALNHVKE